MHAQHSYARTHTQIGGMARTAQHRLLQLQRLRTHIHARAHTRARAHTHTAHNWHAHTHTHTQTCTGAAVHPWPPWRCSARGATLSRNVHGAINTMPSAAVGAGFRGCAHLRPSRPSISAHSSSRDASHCRSKLGSWRRSCLSSQVGSITRTESHRCAAAARQAALEQELAECGEERRRLLKQASYCMARSEEMAVRTEEMRAEHADGMMAAGRWPLFEPTVWPSA